ncbi:MFS transporter [Paraburkholderia tropica]|uniref:MFS transporter n=1 Tax=Paraburkholderia tropica TaxID=92647 RepID=UPI002AB1F374|nr:MFS transporter [Paraburkholderia tropica]
MAIRVDSGRGRAALMVGHCAGMVDLVALPVWVGILIERFHFDPQQAGGLVTIFLGGVVLASVLLAPFFQRLPGRVVATVGYGISSFSFFVASGTSGPLLLTALHGLAGIATGAALSLTHGTMATSSRPHRMMALAGVALGVFAILFMGSVPHLLRTHGGTTLFVVLGGVMAAAAVFAAVFFPTPANRQMPVVGYQLPVRLPRAVWFGMAGFACLNFVQAMANSFLERVGADHGFTHGQVGAALLTMAIFSMFPGALAALLERRISARNVLLIGPALHGLMVVVVMKATVFPAYVASMALVPSLMIFTHTFAFGAIAKMDNSGRALAAMPATLMAGSALAPLVAGTLVKFSGYDALALGAVAFAIASLLCFSRLPKEDGKRHSEVASEIRTVR